MHYAALSYSGGRAQGSLESGKSAKVGKVPGVTEPESVPVSLVRTQLDRMLSSQTFARSERLSAFLRFVVEESVEGRGDALKENVIAAELYGKQLGFEPASDPAVRVDARRLRDKLREYYADSRNDPVIISLPKGSYAPVFERNPNGSRVTPAPMAITSRRLLFAAVSGICILLAGLLVWTWRQPNHPSAWQPVPLTALPGLEGAPSLSPDGNFVVFAWTGPDEPRIATPLGIVRGDLWVKAVGDEAVRRLTDTPEPEYNPAWSPDGREIAFVRGEPARGIYIVSQLGGAERRVSESGNFVAWAPDCKSILVRDYEGNAPYGIYQIFLDSLRRRRLTQPPTGVGVWRFAVSPDGNTLAFSQNSRLGVADVYTVPISGGEPRRRTELATAIDGIAWTADGRDLIFSYRFGGGSGQLGRIAANDSRHTRSAPVLLPVPAFQPSISKPGPGRFSRLAFQTRNTDLSLRLIDLNAEREPGLIRDTKPLFDSTFEDQPGNLSPDSSKLAFTSNRSGHIQLWVGNLDGSGLRQLTSLSGSELAAPSWSADAKRIAFDATIDGNTDIYVIDAGGGPPRRLTTDSSIDRMPSWSQDGHWIYYSSDRSGREQVWKLPSEGGAAKQITVQGGASPVEDLDGKHLYYLSGDFQVSIVGAVRKVAVDGGEETTLVPGVLLSSWAVTRKGIFFLAGEDQPDALALYNPGDGRVTRLGRLPIRVPRQGPLPGLTVSRDGRWVVTNAVDHQSSDLMIVDNFR